MPLVQGFLREQWVSLAVTQVARRRPDEFRDLVRVLKLGTVDLDAGASVAEERLGQSLDDTGFPDPVGPRNNRFPTGRPGAFSPARNIW